MSWICHVMLHTLAVQYRTWSIVQYNMKIYTGYERIWLCLKNQYIYIYSNTNNILVEQSYICNLLTSSSSCTNVTNCMHIYRDHVNISVIWIIRNNKHIVWICTKLYHNHKRIIIQTFIFILHHPFTWSIIN